MNRKKTSAWACCGYRWQPKAGANVIVTACPFCLVNIEDAIKVAGLEGQMEAIDFTELIAGQMDTGKTPRVEEDEKEVKAA
jgi:Fe-S oxidoreductase